MHDAFPKKHLYFTEQMVIERSTKPTIDIAKEVARLIIGAPRNWSRNVILWNLAADQNNDPHTDDGGCTALHGFTTFGEDKKESARRALKEIGLSASGFCSRSNPSPGTKISKPVFG